MYYPDKPNGRDFYFPLSTICAIIEVVPPPATLILTRVLNKMSQRDAQRW